MYGFIYQSQGTQEQGLTKLSAEDYLKERKAQLEQKLKESGEEARLEEFLRQKLIETGWKDDLKNTCKQKIQNQEGLERVTIDQLMEALQNEGTKEDLMTRLKIFFKENSV